MIKNTWRRLLFLMILAGFAGCSKEDEDQLVAPALPAPKVSGIALTDDVGNLMGFWGKPQDKGMATIGNCKVSMMLYPNPFNETAQIQIMRYNGGQNADCPSLISVFAVRLQENSDINGEGQTFASAIMAETGIAPSIVLVKNQPIIYDNLHLPLSFWQTQLPGGFYRIYVKIGSEYLWIDAFRATDCATTPPSLRPFLYYNCN